MTGALGYRSLGSSVSEGEANLRDGGEWADHEDCIIGDEAGLRSLKRACEAAISHGQYFGNDLGEWVGVKKLDSAWFRAPVDSTLTRVGSAAIAFVLLAVLGLAAVGLFSIAAWLSSAA